MTADARIAEIVGFYRPLGFFVSPKTDEEVAAWIARRRRRSYRDESVRRIVRDPGVADGVPEHVAAVGPRRSSRGIWFPELGPVR